jgi:integrase
LIPHYRKLPWIPNDDEWRAILVAARDEPLRNRLMLAFAYDAALRREELCSLLTADIDPSANLDFRCLSGEAPPDARLQTVRETFASHSSSMIVVCQTDPSSRVTSAFSGL